VTQRLRLAGQAAPSTLPLVGLTSLTMRDIKWLDVGFVPANALTIVLGHGGIGKGPWTNHLAAKITRSGGAVLFAAAEDDHESVLKPRLVAAGADMRLVDAISELELPADTERLEATIEAFGNQVEAKVMLIVIDPILSFLSGKVNSYKDHDVKLALKPLIAVLERQQTTGVGVHHLSKDTSRGASFSGQGSTAFRNTARSVLAMALHDEDDRVRLLEVVKSNFGTVGVGRRYRLELSNVPGLQTQQPVLVHEGEADKSVDEALQGQVAERAEVPRAQIHALILRELATGEKARDHLNDRARDELGIGPDPLYKRGLEPLKDDGQIAVRKDGLNGPWLWRRA
jgi:KaiC/GvpD/RAD55 family RecA-like ATPase